MTTPYRYALQLSVLLLFGGTNTVLGFCKAPIRSWRSNAALSRDRWTSRQVQEFKFAEDFTPKATETKKKDDPLEAFKVGCVVRISKAGLKAYQVSPKGYGSYDDNKKFVPLDEETTERKSKNLRVPVGMRGEVTKIYDDEDLSANFQIQVKFEPRDSTSIIFMSFVIFLMLQN